MKQLIIHAGFHKTASSSIQHSLGYNREWLQEQGYLFPELIIEGKSFYNQTIPLYGYFTGKPQNFKHYWYHNGVDHQMVNNRIREILESEVKKHDKVVFSDEFVSTLNCEELVKMKAYFEDMGFEIRVISYVREPFNNIVSVIQQRAKAQNSIQETLENNFLSKFTKRIENIKTVFGENAEFYSFERACQHENGPVGFFFGLLNLELDSSRILKINESTSQQAARISSYVTENSPLYVGGGTLNPIRKKDDLIPVFQLKGVKFQLTKEEADFVQPAIDKSRSEIETLLGEGFLPSVKLNFIEKLTWSDEDLDNVVNTLPGLDLHVNIRIYDYFFKQFNDGIIGFEFIDKIGQMLRLRIDNEMNGSISVKKVKLSLFLANLKRIGSLPKTYLLKKAFTKLK